MPELPDLVLYCEAMARRLVGRRLHRVRLASPFLVRTTDPPLAEADGRAVTGVRRVGKRIVLALEGDLFLAVHLMIAGRFQWKDTSHAAIPRKIGLAAFDYPNGTLLLTEAGTKKRASLHMVRGLSALARLDPGGLEPLAADAAAFRRALTRENHTLKRALTDPGLFSGIGNAYSDEILHRARFSPVKLTRTLTEVEVMKLYEATQSVLHDWVTRLRAEAGDEFPGNVTAFRPGMAVHGRFRQPCPMCGSPIQRIVHAENESNYCARCQTGGKLLADRALSRLLREDWPKRIEDLETPRTLHRS